MSVQTGLDRVLEDGGAPLRGRRCAVLCHHASIAQGFRHILPALQGAKVAITAALSPEHGIWGAKDSRIESTGGIDPKTGVRLHSLYGQTLRPTREMLEGADCLVIDLQDVGARFYTYTWSMAHAIGAAEELGVQVVVLDRPNPIGGQDWEGPVLDPGYSSFIGLHPIAQRHGMTHGEIAKWVQSKFHPKADLVVVPCKGWNRAESYERTGLPWVPPSPNMPRVDTAYVYPGLGLLEGTGLSEGRGTTRPFEIFGHPKIDGWKLCSSMNRLDLPGAHFRPLYVQPTWSKHAGKGCGGAMLHVTDRKAFRPVRTAIELLAHMIREMPDVLEWDQESRRKRFDGLAGCAWLRESLTAGVSAAAIVERAHGGSTAFEQERKSCLLYT